MTWIWLTGKKQYCVFNKTKALESSFGSNKMDWHLLIETETDLHRQVKTQQLHVKGSKSGKE